MATPNAEQRIVLVVDDDRSILEVLSTRLEIAGFEVLRAFDGQSALDVLSARPVDIVVSDIRMPGMGGRELLAAMREKGIRAPVILLTAHGTIPDAVEMVKKGASDYLTKPFDGQELVAKVRQHMPQTPAAAGHVESPLASRIPEVLWGGKSPAMHRLFQLIERIAASDVAVLITGESGTGKERVSRLIHDLSQRSSGPFVIVDCGSTPAGLLESELFGHVKGSFTHAVRDKKGLIEEAAGGTLFLDEIGNISQEMQTRLLRFLQEKTIRRIGDTREFSVDCRVLAATNADLQAMVRDGNFREDLYYRLKVITLNIPPLRDRREDIELLAERFTDQASKDHGLPRPTIAPETMRLFMSYRWPGNVRELKNVLEGAVILAKNDVLRPEDVQLEEELPAERPAVSAAPAVKAEAAAPESGDAMSLEESERRAIIKALEQANWVQKDAADILGISRRAIHYKVKKYDIRIPGRSRRV